MAAFKRSKISSKRFVGYRFSRIRRNAVAGFTFGFLLGDGVLPIRADPPEVVAYAFVAPVGSSLHDELVLRPNSPVRRLVRAGRAAGLPFEFHGESEAVAIRHRSLRRAPPEIFVLAASDFFMLSFRPILAAKFQQRVQGATTRPGP